jgi:hypothetical protein
MHQAKHTLNHWKFVQKSTENFVYSKISLVKVVYLNFRKCGFPLPISLAFPEPGRGYWRREGKGLAERHPILERTFRPPNDGVGWYCESNGELPHRS